MLKMRGTNCKMAHNRTSRCLQRESTRSTVMFSVQNVVTIRFQHFRKLSTMKHKVSKRVIYLKWVTLICITFFVLGAIFTSKSWEPSSDSGSQLISQRRRNHDSGLQIVSDDCAHKKRLRLDCKVNGIMDEVEKKDVYSVWAFPDEETEPRFRMLMEALRSEFSGPRFDPHVTVVGATNLTADEAKKMFESACDGLKAYTATVDRITTGTFFYQCVFLLLKSTPEVMKAGEHCKNHFKCSTTTPYMPHLSLLYAELDEEGKKKAQEKAYTLDNSLDGLSFRLNRLVLCKTDTEDKTLESWEKVAVCNLNP